MNKIILGLATTAIASVAGGVAFSGISSEYLSVANAESSLSDTAVENVEQPSTRLETAIAKTYAHNISGREAITVYVRNIPVVTFLGETPSTPTEKPKATADSTGSEANSSNLTEQSSQLVATINQINPSDFDAEKIGVKWDKQDEQYVIHVEQTPLIAMNGNVTLPKSTKDVGEDALQITNRLRRQIGNVKPLKEIEGRPQPPVQVAAAPTNVRRYQDGWASWYGPGFHGNLTASGTRYNQYALTAAHRTLPFGTRVRVTNRNNGRSVIVTITDRGPYIYDRVIDLSMGAAQSIGVSGVSPVSLDIVN